MTRMSVTEFRAIEDRRRTEHSLQVEVAAWLACNVPASVPWTAVDHGAGKMTPAAAGQRRRRGVKRGQPDFRFILPPDGQSAEIELKRPKGGRQSPEQKEWEARTVEAGGLYLVCRSIAEVQGALIAWGVLPRRPQ
jgi:hypothetical protein